MNNKPARLLILSILLLYYPNYSQAWSEHPMLIYPILRDMPEMTRLPQVEEIGRAHV